MAVSACDLLTTTSLATLSIRSALFIETLRSKLDLDRQQKRPILYASPSLGVKSFLAAVAAVEEIMRLAGKLKCGFYPLPLAEAEAIRNCLEFPRAGFSALDPCIGEGAAFARI